LKKTCFLFGKSIDFVWNRRQIRNAYVLATKREKRKKKNERTAPARCYCCFFNYYSGKSKEMVL